MRGDHSLGCIAPLGTCGLAALTPPIPRPPQFLQPLLDGLMAWRTVYITFLFVVGMLGNQWWSMISGDGPREWQAAAYTTLVLAQAAGAADVAAHGCADCIAPSVAEYERMAVHLYRDAGALQQLTQRVRRNRDAAPLFDTRRWVANFEEALHAAWRMHVDEDRNTRHVQLSDATATAA